MSALFEPGTFVYLRRSGLARIAARAEHDIGGTPTLCYEVERPTGLVKIPVEKAHLLLRPPVSRSDAEAMLAALHAANVQPDPKDVRAKELREDGSPLDHAQRLRRFYALPAPLSHWDLMAVLHLEDLVLDEIAHVLDIAKDELVAEMRTRYPATNSPAL